MKKCFRYLFLLSLFFHHPLALAEEREASSPETDFSQGISLPVLIEHAYEHNPMVTAAREGWRESLERRRVSAAYPDPRIGVTYWPESVADDLDANKVETMLSQDIPFAGKLGAMERSSQATADYNRLALDRAVRDVIVAIRESYHELLYLRDAKRIAKQQQDLLGGLKTLGETAYADNRGTLIDVMKARSQTAQSGYDILLLDELEKTELTRINSLLNRPPESAIGPLADEPYRPLQYPIEEIHCLAERHREEINMAKTEARKMEAETDVARFENYPEFMVGVLYESEAPMESGGSRENMLGLQFEMSLPVWWDKNIGRIEAAKAALRKSRAMIPAQVNETRAMVRENYFRLRNAERLIRLYRDQMIPQAFKSMELAQTWQREGQGSFTDYLETQSVWYNFQLSLSRAAADYGKYLARLESLAGQSLTSKEGESGCSPGEAP